MRNVNARQPGLVSFLDLFTDGRAPDLLGQQIQASIDITPFVQLGKREPLFAQETTTLLGGVLIGIPAPLRVPANEAWIVEQWSVQTGVVLGNTVALYASVFRNAPFPGHRQLGETSTNNGSGLASSYSSAPFLARPGDILAAVFSSNPGGGLVDFFGFAEIVRIRL